MWETEREKRHLTNVRLLKKARLSGDKYIHYKGNTIPERMQVRIGGR
jgi:hypothetical protein